MGDGCCWAAAGEHGRDPASRLLSLPTLASCVPLLEDTVPLLEETVPLLENTAPLRGGQEEVWVMEASGLPSPSTASIEILDPKP